MMDELNESYENERELELKTDPRGFVIDGKALTLDEINSIEPRYFNDFVKFVVDKDTDRVAIGMMVHKSAEVFFGPNHGNLFGGNIFRDGSIIYTSTLNVMENKKNYAAKHKQGIFHKAEPFPGNPRVIEDKEMIEMIDATLFGWVDFEKKEKRE